MHLESYHRDFTTMIAQLHLPCNLDDQASISLRPVAELVIHKRLRERCAEDSLWNGGGDVRLSYDYRTVRCEVEVPAYFARATCDSLMEAVSAPVSAAEASACWEAERESPPRPLDHLRFAIQGALFPDRPRLALPPGALCGIPIDVVSRTISAANICLVSVGGREPWRTAGLHAEPFVTATSSAPCWSAPDPLGPTVRVGRTFTDGRMGRLLVAFRLPGPSHAEWPLSLLLHAMLGSGTAGRVNHALRKGRAASYGANVQLAVLDQDAVLVAEVQCDPRRMSDVMESLEEALFPDEIAESWAEFAQDSAISRLEMLALSPGRLADAIASSIRFTGTTAGLEATPSLLAGLTIDEIRGFARQYLTQRRVRVGIEGGIPEGADAQAVVMESFFRGA